MDEVIDKIAALGVPGVVLLIAISTSGVAGGAAIVAALAFLGGPIGMLGGIAMLGLIMLVSQAITKYGTERLFRGVVNELRAKGMAKDEIRRKIGGYPISKNLKRTIGSYLDELP